MYVLIQLLAAIPNKPSIVIVVEFYLYPTVSTALVHSVKPELTE